MSWWRPSDIGFAVRSKLADLGINIKDVTDKLEADGVAAFIKSGTPSSPTSRLASTASTAESFADTAPLNG